MTFINQHIEEFKILYIFFMFSMLWLDLDESSKENLLKSRYMDSFDISVYIELLDELFTKIIGRITYFIILEIYIWCSYLSSNGSACNLKTSW